MARCCVPVSSGLYFSQKRWLPRVTFHPIILDLLHYKFLFAQSATRLQLIKPHVRGSYLQYRVIEQYILFNVFLLPGIRIPENNRKHIGIPGYGFALNAIDTIVYIAFRVSSQKNGSSFARREVAMPEYLSRSSC